MQRPNSQDETADFYLEEGRIVFTAGYLLRRGTCCGSGCRHCPYRDSEQRGIQNDMATDGITGDIASGPRGGPATGIL